MFGIKIKFKDFNEDDDKYLPDSKFKEALEQAKLLSVVYTAVTEQPDKLNPVILAGLAAKMMPWHFNKKQQYLVITATTHMLMSHKKLFKKLCADAHKKAKEIGEKC